MHQILAYFKFLLKSTNEHGVHSPFVYNLLTECFYKKEKIPAFTIITDFREELLQDKRKINVTDFGAGSRVFSSNRRKISAIAKKAGISKKRAILLNKLCRYLQIKNALELGTSVGISSAAIATDNKTRLTSIEGCPETAKIAAEYFKKYKLRNIRQETGEFKEVIQNLLQNLGYLEPAWPADRRSREAIEPASMTERPSQGADLVYFDGNHQKEATIKYFEKLLPLAHNDSVFIFDDIHWSAGMEEAWEEIKSHPEVRVSIDSFFWGLIFFRKEQEKQHFIVRL